MQRNEATPDTMMPYLLMLTDENYALEVKAAGISKADIELLTQKQGWTRLERENVRSVYTRLVHCTEHNTGYALISVPVEFVASVAVVFVAPLNWYRFATMVAQEGLFTSEQIRTDEIDDQPPDARQILAWISKQASSSTYLGYEEDITNALRKVALLGAVKRQKA